MITITTHNSLIITDPGYLVAGSSTKQVAVGEGVTISCHLHHPEYQAPYDLTLNSPNNSSMVVIHGNKNTCTKMSNSKLADILVDCRREFGYTRLTVQLVSITVEDFGKWTCAYMAPSPWYNSTTISRLIEGMGMLALY